MGFLGVPLGYITWVIFKVIPNYFWTLMVFTLIVRLALFPLAVKQQKTMAKNAIMQPKIKAIQEKYKNDRQKQQEEIAKLGTNPLGGCLPMLLQMLVLLGVYDVVRRPLTHFLHLGDAAISAATTAGGAAIKAGYEQISIINGGGFGIDLHGFSLNFFGLNLGAQAEWGHFSWLWLLPLLSGATAFLSAWFSMKYNAAGAMTDTSAPGAGMTKSMLYIMPALSIFIAFGVPSGLVVYWIMSNVFSIAQVLILNKFWNLKRLTDELKAAEKANKKGVIETTVVDKDGNAQTKKLSKKEADKDRLARAREEYAKKYGEN